MTFRKKWYDCGLDAPSSIFLRAWQLFLPLIRATAWLWFICLRPGHYDLLYVEHVNEITRRWDKMWCSCMHRTGVASTWVRSMSFDGFSQLCFTCGMWIFFEIQETPEFQWQQCSWVLSTSWRENQQILDRRATIDGSGGYAHGRKLNSDVLDFATRMWSPNGCGILKIKPSHWKDLLPALQLSVASGCEERSPIVHIASDMTQGCGQLSEASKCDIFL